MLSRSDKLPLGAVLCSGLAVFAVLGAFAGHAMEGVGGMSTILWRAPSQQSLAIQRRLNFVGNVTADSSTQADARSPADVFVLHGMVSVDLLLDTLLSAYKDIRYGGIQVKRGMNGEIQINNNLSIPGGTIQIDRGPKGTAYLHRLGRPGREQLLELITPILR